MNTKELEKKIQEAQNMTDFLGLCETHATFNANFISTVETYMAANGLKKANVIRTAHIQKNYAYEIFRGEKQPCRDKVICFIFGLSMSVTDGQ